MRVNKRRLQEIISPCQPPYHYFLYLKTEITVSPHYTLPSFKHYIFLNISDAVFRDSTEQQRDCRVRTPYPENNFIE